MFPSSMVRWMVILGQLEVSGGNIGLGLLQFNFYFLTRQICAVPAYGDHGRRKKMNLST